jgi:hypothetical protein
MNTTPRKAWSTPQVFVLGAEGTQAYQKNGTKETPVHYTGLWKHTGGSGFSEIQKSSAYTYKGYES